MASVIIGAVITAGGALLGGASVAGALLWGAITAGLSFIGSLLAPRPKLRGFEDASEFTREIRGESIPARYVMGTTRVSGMLVTHDEHIGPSSKRRTQNKTAYQTYIIAEGECNRTIAVYINGKRHDVIGTKSNGALQLGPSKTPLETGAKPKEGYIDIWQRFDGSTPHPFIANSQAPSVDSTMLFREKSYFAVSINQPGIAKAEDRIWPGLPKIEFVVEGLKIQASWQSRKEWTDNPAIIREWYLRTVQGYIAEEIDGKSFQVAAAICANPETVRNLPTEYRNAGYDTTNPTYQFGGVIVPSVQEHESIINELDFAIGGGCPEQNGITFARPGYVRTPTTSIDPKDVIQRSMQPTGQLSDNVNRITMAVGQNRYNDFVSEILPEIIDEEQLRKDGRDYPLNAGQKVFVNNPVIAAKAMTIMLRRARNNLRLIYKLLSTDDYRYQNLKPLDTVRVTDTFFDIDNLVFIVDSVQINEDNTTTIHLQLLAADTYNPNLKLPSLGDQSNYIFPGLETRPPSPQDVIVSAIPGTTQDGVKAINLNAEWDNDPFDTEVILEKANDSGEIIAATSASTLLTTDGSDTRGLQLTTTGTGEEQNNFKVNINSPSSVLPFGEYNERTVQYVFSNVPTAQPGSVSVRSSAVLNKKRYCIANYTENNTGISRTVFGVFENESTIRLIRSDAGSIDNYFRWSAPDGFHLFIYNRPTDLAGGSKLYVMNPRASGTGFIEMSEVDTTTGIVTRGFTVRNVNFNQYVNYPTFSDDGNNLYIFVNNRWNRIILDGIYVLINVSIFTTGSSSFVGMGPLGIIYQIDNDPNSDKKALYALGRNNRQLIVGNIELPDLSQPTIHFYVEGRKLFFHTGRNDHKLFEFGWESPYFNGFDETYREPIEIPNGNIVCITTNNQIVEVDQEHNIIDTTTIPQISGNNIPVSEIAGPIAVLYQNKIYYPVSGKFGAGLIIYDVQTKSIGTHIFNSSYGRSDASYNSPSFVVNQKLYFIFNTRTAPNRSTIFVYNTTNNTSEEYRSPVLPSGSGTTLRGDYNLLNPILSGTNIITFSHNTNGFDNRIFYFDTTTNTYEYSTATPSYFRVEESLIKGNIWVLNIERTTNPWRWEIFDPVAKRFTGTVRTTKIGGNPPSNLVVSGDTAYYVIDDDDMFGSIDLTDNTVNPTFRHPTGGHWFILDVLPNGNLLIYNFRPRELAIYNVGTNDFERNDNYVFPAYVDDSSTENAVILSNGNIILYITGRPFAIFDPNPTPVSRTFSITYTENNNSINGTILQNTSMGELKDAIDNLGIPIRTSYVNGGLAGDSTRDAGYQLQFTGGQDEISGGLISQTIVTQEMYSYQLQEIGTYRLTLSNLSKDGIASLPIRNIFTTDWNGIIADIPDITGVDAQLNGNILSIYADAIIPGTADSMEIRFVRVPVQLADPPFRLTEEQWDSGITGQNFANGTGGTYPISADRNGVYAQFALRSEGKYSIVARYSNAVGGEGNIARIGTFRVFDIASEFEGLETNVAEVQTDITTIKTNTTSRVALIAKAGSSGAKFELSATTLDGMPVPSTAKLVADLLSINTQNFKVDTDGNLLINNIDASTITTGVLTADHVASDVINIRNLYSGSVLSWTSSSRSPKNATLLANWADFEAIMFVVGLTQTMAMVKTTELARAMTVSASSANGYRYLEGAFDTGGGSNTVIAVRPTAPNVLRFRSTVRPYDTRFDRVEDQTNIQIIYGVNFPSTT